MRNLNLGIYLKLLGKGLLYFVLAVITFGTGLYVRSKWYNFPERAPFSGDEFYNPYQDLASSRGFMCNFHAHSNSWNGFTNGHGTGGDVLNKYNQMGYDIACVSNYHQMNGGSDITCYEHGWGTFKDHQIVIDAEQVTWLDFPLYQNENQHQFMLNYLNSSNENAIVAIAHPAIRSAYKEADFTQLSGYHLFEALNKLKKSFREWDIVLSSGYPAFVLGSDDCHNYQKPGDVGRCGTYVFTSNPNKQSIKQSLKTGKSFAVEFGGNPEGDDNAKKTMLTVVTKPSSLINRGDSVFLTLKDSVASILVITDRSDTLQKYSKTSFASFNIPPSSSYIRIEYRDFNGSRVYLNPIIRTNNGNLPVVDKAEVNHLKTAIYRGLILFFWMVVWSIIVRYEYNRYRSKRARNSENGVFTPTPHFRSPGLDGV